MTAQEKIKAANQASEQSQLQTLKGFQEMEDTMEQLKQETLELERQKEQEAIKLKEKAAAEAKIKEKLDETARSAIKARRLESKMMKLREQATEKLFVNTENDIKKKVKAAQDAAFKSSQLAQEISEETTQMESELKSIESSTFSGKSGTKMTQIPSQELQ